MKNLVKSLISSISPSTEKAKPVQPVVHITGTDYQIFSIVELTVTKHATWSDFFAYVPGRKVLPAKFVDLPVLLEIVTRVR